MQRPLPASAGRTSSRHWYEEGRIPECVSASTPHASADANTAAAHDTGRTHDHASADEQRPVGDVDETDRKGMVDASSDCRGSWLRYLFGTSRRTGSDVAA